MIMIKRVFYALKIAVHAWSTLCCYNRIPDQSNLKKRGLFWFTVPEYSPSWQGQGRHDARSLKQLVTSHTWSGSRVMNGCFQFTFSFLKYYGMVLPTFRRVFIYQLKQSMQPNFHVGQSDEDSLHWHYCRWLWILSSWQTNQHSCYCLSFTWCLC